MLFAQRCRALGERLDRTHPARRPALRQRRARRGPGERIEESGGALVAVRRRARRSAGRARTGRGRFRRTSAATRAPARRRARTGRRARCWPASTLAAERFRGLDAGAADAGRRLLDQRRDRRGLGVDAGADLFERGRGAVEQGVERAEKLTSASPTPRPRRRPALSICGQMRRPGAGGARRPARRPRGARSARAPTCSPKSAACAPTRCRRRASCSAMRRAVASARGRSSSSTPMSLRADSAARSSASPCVASRSVLQSSSRVMPPSLPVASSPSSISCSAIVVSSARLSSIRCDSTSSSASSECASVRIATTERVKRSASLRRVRPNMIQAGRAAPAGRRRSRPIARSPARTAAGPQAPGPPTRRYSRATARQGSTSALPSTCRPPAPWASACASRMSCQVYWSKPVEMLAVPQADRRDPSRVAVGFGALRVRVHG